MALNNYVGRNRTAEDSGVIIDGPYFASTPITGLGVTPAQTAALAAPLLAFLQQIPYDLDEKGQLAHRKSTRALNHLAELVYAPDHPDAGQPVFAGLLDGDYITKYGGAPMPFIDMDRIHPDTLAIILSIMTTMATQIATAT